MGGQLWRQGRDCEGGKKLTKAISSLIPEKQGFTLFRSTLFSLKDITLNLKGTYPKEACSGKTAPEK